MKLVNVARWELHQKVFILFLDDIVVLGQESSKKLMNTHFGVVSVTNAI